MAQGKLSQQLQSTSEQQQRPSRTQRVRQNLAVKRDKQRFEQLKAEARKIQETQFKDKVVQESYIEFRPKKYSEKEWNKLSQNQKDAILKPYRQGRGLDYYANRGELVRMEKTREKTLPFTLDEGENSYENIYAGLSPELKALFAPPEQLKQEKADRITGTKTQAQQRIDAANQKIKDLEAKYNQEKQELKERWQRKSSSYRNDPRNRERYKEDRRELEDDYEEDRAEQLGIIKGLGKGVRELNKGKDLSFNDILNYAEDVGNYEQDKKEARNRNREIKRKEQKRINDAIKEVETRGGRFERITEYKNGVAQGQKVYAVVGGKYTLLGESKAQANLSKFTKPSELGKAEITQSYNIGGKTLTFKGIEQLYVSEKTGELYSPFGAIGKKEADVLASQNAALKEAQKEREQKASAYLTEQGFETKASQPAESKTSLFGKALDFGKTLYAITPFGTSLKLPDEYLDARKPISTPSKQNLFGFNTGIGGQISLYSLDPKTAYEGVKAQRRKDEEAKLQSDLIGELGILTDKAPEEIQYEVQQRGISILEGRGVDATFDEKTGLIKFSSSALKPSKTYNIFELEKAQAFDDRNLDKPYVFSRTTPERKGEISLPYQTRGTATFNPQTNRFEAEKTPYTIPAKTTTYSPATIGVRTRIVATKAAEFYLIGKGVGAVIGLAAKGGGAVYSGLGGGLRVTDATVRGGNVYATVEATKGLGKVGTALKIGGTGALFVAGGGLYVAGKVQQKRSYEEQYGDIGKEAFKYETIGELVGIGALIGEGVYKRNQARKLQERIAQENYIRQQRAERLRNVKQYGQYSRFAEVSYKGAGTGRKLTKQEATELARLYSEATGVSKAKATSVIREAGLYKQSLKVGSPLGDVAYKGDKFALVTSSKTSSASREIAFEFTRIRGGKPENLILKATTGKGKYAVTSIFEKARYSPLQPTKDLRLQKVVISKIVKARSVQVADGYNIKAFNVESRLLKTYPYGKERLAAGEALKLGLPKYSQKDLAKLFIRAGASARTSPLPISNLRFEVPAFRDTGQGFKIALEGRYDFAQAGKGGRQLALKNILKDIDFRNLERALYGSRTKTPLSVTFGSDGSLKAVTSTKGGSAAAKASSAALTKLTGQKAVQVTVQNVAVSPTVQADLKVKVIEKLLTGAAVSTASASRTALTAAISGALGLRSRQQLRTELRARQVQNQVQQQRTQQNQTQTQQQRQSQISSSVNVFPEPRINIPEISAPPTRTPRPATAGRPIVIFGDDDRLEKKLLQRRRARGVENIFLLPDFATRILGLSPQTVGSEKEALREINRIQTGLELRRGLRIRA